MTRKKAPKMGDLGLRHERYQNEGKVARIERESGFLETIEKLRELEANPGAIENALDWLNRAYKYIGEMSNEWPEAIVSATSINRSAPVGSVFAVWVVKNARVHNVTITETENRLGIAFLADGTNTAYRWSNIHPEWGLIGDLTPPRLMQEINYL